MTMPPPSEKSSDRSAVAPEPSAPGNPVRRVLLASLIGSAIEFFDFYIFGIAASLVFPTLFFPSHDPVNSMLASFATFAVAFFARPIGSVLFGHFGDRVGRKTTLVAALMLMGVSTVLIGVLPTYHQVGVLAPLLLAVLRCGQGLGLGGEWGGAVLLAVENAGPRQRAWFGMFPQLGAPIGFFLSSLLFVVLSNTLTKDQFLAFGWRIPFLASAVLVGVGLWVRLRIEETPVFRRRVNEGVRERVPVLTVLRRHPVALLRATLMPVSGYVLFYLVTVFSLSWGTKQLGYSSSWFLTVQMISVLCFAATVPLSALLLEHGRRRTFVIATVATGLFGFVMPGLLGGGPMSTIVCMVVGMALTGMFYGPLGTTLSEMFPTEVRYTGSSLAFNTAGVLGASFAPFIATSLAQKHGLWAVGAYLGIMSVLSLLSIVGARETRDADL